jgi:hypothetical protein
MDDDLEIMLEGMSDLDLNLMLEDNHFLPPYLKGLFRASELIRSLDGTGKDARILAIDPLAIIVSLPKKYSTDRYETFLGIKRTENRIEIHEKDKDPEKGKRITILDTKWGDKI